MKKFWDILKFAGILVCIVLFISFQFFDIIDLIIPGDFPDWVYVVELIAWAVFGVAALVVFIKERRKNKR